MGTPLSGQCVITREIAVAEGVFAPGYLGELMRIVPFEMVDAALAQCGSTQKRLRKLLARVVAYLLLAAALFEECGYLAMWSKLTSALDSLPIPRVTATALWHARARLGARPLRALLDLLRGPASAIRTAGARSAGVLVVAIDGTYLDVADGPATRAHLGKGSNQYATSGYPQICLVALVECGTRAVIDAVFGPRGDGGETGHRLRLARSLNPDVIVLLDRGFSSNNFLEAAAGTRAALLARLSALRKPPVLRRLPDNSFLSRTGQLEVRIIAQITTTTGRTTGLYRLATTPSTAAATRSPPRSAYITSAARWRCAGWLLRGRSSGGGCTSRAGRRGVRVGRRVRRCRRAGSSGRVGRFPCGRAPSRA